MINNNSGYNSLQNDREYVFDPKNEVQKILKLPSNERKEALKNFYKNLEIFYKELDKIFDYIREEFRNSDWSDLTFEEMEIEKENFIKNFQEKISHFSQETQQQFNKGVREYIDQRIEAYKKFLKFGENPEGYLKEMGYIRGEIADLKYPIKVDVLGANLVFTAHEKEDSLFEAEWNGGYHDSINKNIVIRNNDRAEGIREHELRHAENNFIMSHFYNKKDFLLHKVMQLNSGYLDISQNKNVRPYTLEYKKIMENALRCFQDEVIATLRGGRTIDELWLLLLSGEAYDFFAYWKDFFPSGKYFDISGKKDTMHIEWQVFMYGDYEKMWEEYRKKTSKYLIVLENLLENNVSFDILAVTPIEKWERILKNFENYKSPHSGITYKEFSQNTENRVYKKKINNGPDGEMIGLNTEGEFFATDNPRYEWAHNKLIGGWRYFKFGTLFNVAEYGKIASMTNMLQDGFSIRKNGRVCEYKNFQRTSWQGRMTEKIENGNIGVSLVLQDTHNEGVLLFKKGEFTFKDDKVGMLNGKIGARYSDFSAIRERWRQKRMDAEKRAGIVSGEKSMGETLEIFGKKFDLTSLFDGLENFFPTESIILTIVDGKIDISQVDEKKLNKFLQKHPSEDLVNLLHEYGYSVQMEQNNFKKRISKTLS